MLHRVWLAALIMWGLACQVTARAEPPAIPAEPLRALQGCTAQPKASAVVLVFIYGDTWPVCHGQLARLREKLPAIHEAGAVAAVPQQEQEACN